MSTYIHNYCLLSRYWSTNKSESFPTSQCKLAKSTTKKPLLYTKWHKTVLCWSSLLVARASWFILLQICSWHTDILEIPVLLTWIFQQTKKSKTTWNNPQTLGRHCQTDPKTTWMCPSRKQVIESKAPWSAAAVALQWSPIFPRPGLAA